MSQVQSFRSELQILITQLIPFYKTYKVESNKIINPVHFEDIFNMSEMDTDGMLQPWDAPPSNDIQDCWTKKVNSTPSPALL